MKSFDFCSDYISAFLKILNWILENLDIAKVMEVVSVDFLFDFFWVDEK